MVFIADYFALGLVIALFLFYSDSKRFLTNSDKCFVASLLLTSLTAIIDLLTGHLLTLTDVPLWLNIGVNSLYFLINIVTTSSIALFIFIKILEHSHDNHCMRYACNGLIILFSIYSLFIIANVWTGWLFYFDEHGVYTRGPLNGLGYLITVFQMVLVLICYCRNYKNANKAMKRALIQTFPVIILCIIVQRVYPEIMLNGMIMSMVDMILFLNFQGQHRGVHTLTKLNDRHRFFKDVEHRITAKETFQVFLINLKNFGVINQKYGHLLGDEILYQFAFALEKLFKNSYAFHMNGTVFALTLPYATQGGAETSRNMLLNFLEEGIYCNDELIHTEYVLVEYLVDDSDSDAAEFYEKLEYAASLAYQEKSHYIKYTPAVGEQMLRNRYLIERMQNIDREHGFQVWFQPICCVSTGEFCSMEALLRLVEPDGSLISPGEFIPLAEQTGMISSITWFVIEEVCQFLSAHQELDSVSVSINTPMTQLLEKSFAVRLNSITNRYQIEHRRICLEFTERAILENFQKTKRVMESLTAEGYRFFLDDFGIGYSNFNCLLQLPFHSIKLDASLNPTEEKNRTNIRLVDTLTKLFHSMNLKVIAEGAETQKSVELLQKLDVDKIQGYIYTKPLNQDDLLAFYKNNSL